jgi:hypothetical protein
MVYNNITKLKVCVEGKVLVSPDPFPIHLKMVYLSFLIYWEIKERKVLVEDIRLCWLWLWRPRNLKVVSYKAFPDGDAGSNPAVDTYRLFP